MTQANMLVPGLVGVARTDGVTVLTTRAVTSGSPHCPLPRISAEP